MCEKFRGATSEVIRKILTTVPYNRILVRRCTNGGLYTPLDIAFTLYRESLSWYSGMPVLPPPPCGEDVGLVLPDLPSQAPRCVTRGVAF